MGLLHTISVLLEPFNDLYVHMHREVDKSWFVRGCNLYLHVFKVFVEIYLVELRPVL